MTQDLGILKQLLISSHKRNSNGYKYTCNLNGLEVAITIPMDKVEEVLANLVCDALVGGTDNQLTIQTHSPLQGLTTNANSHAPGDSVLANTGAQNTSYSPSVNNLVSRADNQHAMQTTGETAQSATLQETAQPSHNQKIISTNRNNFTSVQRPQVTAMQAHSVCEQNAMQNPQRGDATAMQNKGNNGIEKNQQNKSNKQVQDAIAKRLDELSVVSDHTQTVSERLAVISNDKQNTMQVGGTHTQTAMQGGQRPQAVISNETPTPTLKPIEEEQQTQTQQNTVQTEPTTVGGLQQQADQTKNEKNLEDKKKTPYNINSDGGRSLLEIDKPAETINWQKLMDYWNSTAGKVCGRIQSMTEFRKNHIRKRIDEYGKDKFIEVISLVQQSEFLTGGNDKGWRADFDWMIRPQNFIKVLEGKYTNQKPNYNNGQFNSRGHPSPYANLSARIDSILAGKAD